MEKNRIKKVIEAVIFTSESPVAPSSLKSGIPELASEDIGAIFKEMVEEWNGLDRALELVKVAGGYQFRTRKEYAGEIIKFNKKIRKLRLSKAALEVLAISAYQQPLTKADVEEIRGVDSSAVVNLLMERRLLEICGRKDVPGRPFLYKTTDAFLETFGINKLSELPTLKEIEEIERDLGAQTLPYPESEPGEPVPDSAPADSQIGDDTENP